MPELPENFMFSERLEKLHASMDSSRVVSVCAPAGYGKTTLATSYFHRRDCPPSRICWYRLDPEDRNLPAFIAHFAESVFPQMILASSNPEGCLRNMPIWNPSPNRPLP